MKLLITILCITTFFYSPFAIAQTENISNKQIIGKFLNHEVSFNKIEAAFYDEIPGVHGIKLILKGTKIISSEETIPIDLEMLITDKIVISDSTLIPRRLSENRSPSVH